MAILVRFAIQYFMKSALDQSVAGGKLYIGEIDKDPTITGNQITVSALQENGSLVGLTQPITLSTGGVPLYNGSPVSLYVDDEYSLALHDANDVQIYYVPSAPGAIVDSLTVSSWPENNNIAQFDGARGLEDSGESISEIGVLDTAAEWTAQQNFNESALSSSSNAVAWNLDLAQSAYLNMTENTTISAPTNMNAGGTYIIRIEGDGSSTLAWNAAFIWGTQSAPSEPAANGDIIIVSFYSDGTSMYGAEFIREEA